MDVVEARPLPGGPLAVDLLNTAWNRRGDARGERHDWLASPAAVQSFARSHSVEVGDDQVDAVRQSLQQARDVVSDLFGGSLLADPEPSANADALLSQARLAMTATPTGPDVVVVGDDGTSTLAIRAVLDAVELLQDRPDRIRSCEHPDCVLWFYDTSKAGRRRWCSMDQCGNRAKAKRHYNRSVDARSADSGAPSGDTAPTTAPGTARS